MPSEHGQSADERQYAQLYARWEDVELRVREAVEAVLTDHDPAEGPPLRAQIEWAQEVADKVTQQVDLHLDGYTAADIAEEDE